MSILFFLCFVLKSGKYSYTQIFLEECKYRIKKKIVIKSVIKDDLKALLLMNLKKKVLKKIVSVL